MSFPGRFTPNVLDGGPSGSVAIVSPSGDAPIWHPYRLVSDGTRVLVLPGVLTTGFINGNTFVRCNLTDRSVYDFKHTAVTEWMSTVTGAVHVGSGDIWVAGAGASFTGFLVKITSSTSLSIPNRNERPLSELNTTYYLAGLDYDGTDLWSVDTNGSPFGRTVRINPASPGSPTYVVTAEPDLMYVKIDQNAANHGGTKKGFSLTPTGGKVVRFSTATGAIDDTVTVTTPRGLAGVTSAGDIFVIDGNTTVRKYDKDLTLLTSSSTLDALYDELSWIGYNATDDKVWVLGLNKAMYRGAIADGNNCLVARLNASTLAVESIVELGTNGSGGVSVDQGGTGLVPFGNFHFIGNDAVVPDPQDKLLGSDGTPNGGNVYVLSGGGSAAISGPDTGGQFQILTGAAASFTNSPLGTFTIDGLTGMHPSFVGQIIRISGGASPETNGEFVIESYVSATEVKVTSTRRHQGTDANNTSLSWRVGDPRFTAAGSTFITDGVQAGDLLAYTESSESGDLNTVFVVESVVSETQLIVTNPYGYFDEGDSGEDNDFYVFRPFAKEPLTKAADIPEFGVVDQSWRSFEPVYESDDAAALLNDGLIIGRYRRVGDTVDVVVSVTRGTDTTFGSDTFFLPIPPDVSVAAPTSRMDLYGTAVGYNTVIPLPAVAQLSVYGPALGAIIASLSTFLPSAGDSLALSYSLPVRRR